MKRLALERGICDSVHSLLSTTCRDPEPLLIQLTDIQAEAVLGALRDIASSQGESLVSKFTAGMHLQEPVLGHILPMILSWHLGIELVHFARSTTRQLDPAYGADDRMPAWYHPVS